MPFDHGPITFRLCHLPKPLPADALARFASHAAGPLESVRDEPQWGWVSGRHLLERRVDEETSSIAGYLHLSLRKAERKIPPALLRAECRMAELAQMAAEKKDRISRKDRKTIKEEVTERLLPQMPPQLSGTPFCIDVADNVLYAGATSQALLDTFLSLFCKSIGFEPVPLTPETAAEELFDLDAAGLPQLNFSPELSDQAVAGTVGQNFLTWLWFFLEERSGVLPATKFGEFSMMVDGPLVLVAEGPGAYESVIRKGMPVISAEAKAALTVGKKLSRARLVLVRAQSEQWSVTFDADEFLFRGLKLPEGEAMDPVGIFEERMTNLYIFQKAFFALYERFLKEFSSPAAVSAFEGKAKQWVKERDGK
ncbi:MAG: recombination-associated protein RdgC [Lentisphaeria bacterium]|nr:recombination-associated protein RdgC [Lentisphaeria bacterium]